MKLRLQSLLGVFIYDLMVRYGVGIPVLWIALWEVISIMWIYGYNNMSKEMLNFQKQFLKLFIWKILIDYRRTF